MPLVRENLEDLGSSQDSDLLPATLALRQTLFRVNNQTPLQAVNEKIKNLCVLLRVSVVNNALLCRDMTTFWKQLKLQKMPVFEGKSQLVESSITG